MNKNPKVVLTNGVFDLLHAGHMEYLRGCKELGDILVVGVNDDLTARSLKGEGRPINSVDERVTLLTGCKYVDRVVVFHDVRPIDLLHQVQPDIYVKGIDYLNKWIPEFEVTYKYGGEVILLELEDKYKYIRTTEVIERIKQI